MKKYLALKDIVAYRVALSVSNKIWALAVSWSPFARDTIGKQFVRAVDSISANIAEGFGRYTKRDKINFYR
jgi:four helix bundle protein